MWLPCIDSVVCPGRVFWYCCGWMVTRITWNFVILQSRWWCGGGFIASSAVTTFIYQRNVNMEEGPRWCRSIKECFPGREQRKWYYFQIWKGGIKTCLYWNNKYTLGTWYLFTYWITYEQLELRRVKLESSRVHRERLRANLWRGTVTCTWWCLMEEEKRFE